MHHMRTLRRTFLTGVLVTALAVFFSLTLLVPTVRAGEYAIVNPNESVVVNGAIFEAYNPNTSAGTGTYQSFLRVQKNGTESGYNTDGKLEFDTKSGTWTHSIRLSGIPLVLNPLTATGWYREFRADLNQVASSEGPRITLDELEIYVTHNPSLTSYPFGTEAVKVWELDAGGQDNVIKMNADLSAGSGKGDIQLYIPNNLFDVSGYTNCGYDPNGTSCTTYVVLYTKFGGEPWGGITYEASDGFEEWGVITYTPATKSGVKFNDLNHNGVRDAGEPGLSGWTIYVDYNDNGALDAGEPSAVTGALGAYTISGIVPAPTRCVR